MGPEVSYFLSTKKFHACLQAFTLIAFPLFFWNTGDVLGPYHISQITCLLLTLQPTVS